MIGIQHSLLDARLIVNPMNTQHDPQALHYILSAGRTGTVFISKLFETHASNIVAEHEPALSRYLMMLGNARNDLGIFKSLTHRFSQAHQNAHFSKDNRYIEINPFLCPITDTLPRDGHGLKILHIVRHPADWSHSITSFKASAKLRSVIDYIPFAKPYPSPRPKGWLKLDKYEKALWRWHWCNSQILALKETADQYVLVRYEDLFSQDRSMQLETIQRIFNLFDLEVPSEIAESSFQEKVNPSPKMQISRNPIAEKTICGDLAKAFGYEL